MCWELVAVDSATGSSAGGEDEGMGHSMRNRLI